MAKRQRINIKFIVIILLGGCVLAGGYLVARKTILRPDPKKYVAQGHEAAEKGDWEAASKAYEAAIRYHRGAPDPTVWLLLSDAYRHLTPKDPATVVRTWKGTLDQALATDPGNPEALRREVDFYLEYVQTFGRAEAKTYSDIEDYARKLLAVEPENSRAKFALAFATLDQWMQGIQLDPAKVDAAEASLAPVMASDPKNADVPSLLAKMKLTRAANAYRAGEGQKARDLMTELDTLVTERLAANPDDPKMHIQMAQFLNALAERTMWYAGQSSTAPVVSQEDVAKLPPEQRAVQVKRLEYLRRTIDATATAAKLVKPGDEDYAESLLSYARQLELPAGLLKIDSSPEEIAAVSKDAAKKAEDLYREVLKNEPWNRTARLLLSRFIGKDPARRDEAIALLQEQVGPDPALIGVRGYIARIQTGGSIPLALADLRLDAAESTADKAEREKILAIVEPDVEKAGSVMGPMTGAVLQVKGRMQLLRGQTVEATQTLNRAMGAFMGSMEDRLELMLRLSQAYMMTGQSGEARNLLLTVVSAQPSHIMARLQLAELMIREGNITGTAPSFGDGAMAQLQILERIIGADHPAIARLKIMIMERGDKSQLDAQFAKIPEATPQQRFEKAKLAAQLQKAPEAIRLLELMRAEKPGMPEIAQPLAAIYAQANEKDKAIAVLQEAIAANPQNKALPMQLQQLVDPSKLEGQILQSIQDVADPLTRELAFAEFYRERNNEPEMWKHVSAAEKVAPDDTRVLAQMFALSVGAKDWEKAGGYAERLGKRNADQADGQVYRVQLALAQGNLEQAYDQARKLTQIRGEFAQSWALYGRVLLARGRFDEAISAYQSALDRQPQNFESIKGIIDAYMSSNRPGKASNPSRGQRATDARQYIEMGEKIFPNSPVFKEVALRWEITYGDPERAIKPRADAVKSRPEDPAAWLDLGNAYIAASLPRRPDGAQQSAPQDEARSQKYLKQARDTLAEGLAKFPKELRLAAVLAETQFKLKEIDAAEKTVLAMLETEQLKGKPEGTLMLAEFYARANKPQQAEKVLRDAVAANPTNVQFQLQLSSLLSRMGRLDESLKVLDANLSDNNVVRTRTQLMISYGRIEEAGKFIGELIAKNPDIEFYDRLRGTVALAAGRLDEVKQIAEKLFAKNADDPDAFFFRARANMLQSGADLQAIISDLKRVVELQPDSTEPRLYLAAAYVRAEQTDEAIRTFEGVVQMLPYDINMRLRLLDAYMNAKPPRWYDAEKMIADTRALPQFASEPAVVHAESRMWLLRGEPGKAMQLMRDVIKDAPNNLSFVNTYLSILVDQADFRTLQVEADKAIAQNPKTPTLYQFRAVARLRGQKDPKGALADLSAGMQVAIENKDDQSVELLARIIGGEIGLNEAQQALAPLAAREPYWQLITASIYQNGGNPRAALDIVEKVLAKPDLRPQVLHLALRMAGALYSQVPEHNVAKSIESFRRLLKENPNDVEALNNIAYALLEPGPTYAPTEAVQFSARALELTRAIGRTDALPLIMDTHAWALVCSGNLDEGISLLKTALEKKRVADIFYHLGEALLKKDPPAALEAERALLDGKNIMDDEARQKKPVDKALRAKLESALERAKSLRAASGETAPTTTAPSESGAGANGRANEGANGGANGGASGGKP